MAICLELANGEYAGRSVRLEPGAACRVGAKMGIEFAVPDDPSLGPEHFVALFSKKGVDIHPLGGRKVTRVGDWLIAGESIFRITAIEAPLGPTPDTPIDQAAFVLQSVPDLYAMVDVANDREWKRRLESGVDPAQPIADGYSQSAQAGGEPWLVHVAAQNALIAYIVRHAWGQGRVAFLQSKYSFASLKAFCQSKLADPAKRFYDPRWLRIGLRALPAAESAEWLGPIEEIRVESRFPRQMERWKGTALEITELGLRPQPRLPLSSEIQGHETLSPARARRAAELGLNRPNSIAQYAMVGGDPALDELLRKSEDPARALDFYTIAANRRREGAAHVPA